MIRLAVIGCCLLHLSCIAYSQASAKANDGRLNVRIDPSLEYGEIVGKVEKNQIVSIRKRTDQMYLVQGNYDY